MISDIKFSLPLWPGLSPEEIEGELYPFLDECADVIADLYFTARIPPFNTDAMGGLLVEDEIETVISNAIIIGETFGIPVSATFNNVQVNPSYENYLLFVKNFRPYFERGVKIITIPHTSWLKFGLKDEFPGLFVKNTILNKVNTAAEVAELFAAGFDYINLDRNLVRDESTLAEIARAKKVMSERLGKDLYLSLLYNEMCANNCSVQQDHYRFNLQRTFSGKTFFASELGRVAPCKATTANDAAWVLKSASVPSFYSQLHRLSGLVDVFKMHGREDKQVFYDSLNIIRSFVRRQPIVDPYRKIFDRLSENDRKLWEATIRKCKFNCWKCALCDTLANKLKESK